MTRESATLAQQAQSDSFAAIDGARIRYRLDGPIGAPFLVLSNSLGTNLDMWEPQIAAFAARYRVLRYDSRGHGLSEVTPGPYTIERLARDVVALQDELKIDRAHFCGLSMGGMAGMWLGVHAPQRIDRLVLCNTALRIGSVERWNARIDAVNRGGVSGIADALMEVWFTPGFRAAAADTVQRMRAMLIASSAEGYVASCAAADADRYRHARCRDAARRRQTHGRGHTGREVRRTGCGAYFECRSGRSFHRRGAGVS